MSDVLAGWDEFSGGHWGNLGPTKAAPNQWGGKNVTVDEHGWLAPFSAAIPMTFTNQINGQVLGMFWAYGADDIAYIIALRGGAGTTTDVYRFSTKPYSASYTFTTTTSFASSSHQKDWTLSGTTLYLTAYANKTYSINTATNVATKLTGTYGDAPGGIAICQYGERLVVANLSDARLGSSPQRIAWSGDDTGNDPTVRTAWETLNYLDIGPPGEGITALYPTRDALYIVFSDKSIWQLTGTLGTNEVVRRLNGYSKGTQSIDAYYTYAGAVDPSNTRVWMFNHQRWGLDRFNGASISPVQGFGSIRSDRGQYLTSTRTYGDVVAHGGADEVAAFGVALGNQSGIRTSAPSDPLVLVRNTGINAVADVADIVSWGYAAATPFPRVMGNDRHGLILNLHPGGFGVSSSPTFAYWYGDAPPWDAALNNDEQTPYFASRLSTTSAVTFNVSLPYRKPLKANTEWEIDGVRVDYVPRPQALSTATSPTNGASFDRGNTSSTFAVTLSATVIGDGIPSFARGAAVGTSGAYSSSTFTWTSTYGDGASDIWPNMRTAFFPCRMARVRGARVILSGNDVRIVNVNLLGKQVPGRTA